MPSKPGLPARVYLHTLGCPKNEADTRSVARGLSARGVSVVGDPDQATHIVINTCGFIEDAKAESIGAILSACEEYADRPILVMGCLVERYREELERGIPEVAGWFGLAGTDVLKGLRESVAGAKPESGPGPGTLSGPTTSYAYVKISDGCDESCNFCAIPAIKGPYHSVSVGEIMREADSCLAEGVRELVLVGQDTSRWTGDGLDLCGLVGLLAADARVRRLRVMYLQPEGVNDAFLRYMASEPKLCRYLDVPFQHSHPRILRAMGRGGDGASYLDLIERARRLMPDVTVRSTFIVGFPGETDEEFDHLLEFVDRVGFDYAGGFVYSPEEGTRAAQLRPRVTTAKAIARLNLLTEALAVRAEHEHERLVGKQVVVMIDESGPDDAGDTAAAVGRTEGQAPEVDGVTHIEGGVPEGAGPGDLVTVTVTAAMGYDLLGTCDAA